VRVQTPKGKRDPAAAERRRGTWNIKGPIDLRGCPQVGGSPAPLVGNE